MSGAGFWMGFIVTAGGAVAKAGRQRSLQFRRDIKVESPVASVLRRHLKP